jgi:hypothetical protein
MIEMKYIFFTLIILLTLEFSFGQSISTETTDESGVYNIALSEFIDYIQNYFPKAKEITLEKSLISTTWLSSNFENINITQLQEWELPREFKKRKGKLYYVRIVPLRFKDNIFFINVIPFKVSMDGKNVSLINSGALTVKFKYDCNTQNLMFIETTGGFQQFE